MVQQRGSSALSYASVPLHPMRNGDMPSTPNAPAPLHQLRRALMDDRSSLEIEGIHLRGTDHSLYFELVYGNTVRPLMSVWFNVERHQYTLMSRTSILAPGRPMSDTRARLARYLHHHARQHGWGQASRH